ncbi:zinc finger protein [Sodiomyces alkalinus F11]|uniref:Zinc finger protein n=1 Tax=Sodiomyces alkalinus (strain CBS 110278 / VKM F-3762 / F11) TaxID=1314773 RepID=A0A3N2PSF5_SODAK|nr:zinc finger protein [Sodiomyces alkalinus F11]ROT37437.1 zinc finger protein [Sodiomyces alkalinus F11]
MDTSDSSDNESRVAMAAFRPAKRQRLGDGSPASSAAVHDHYHDHDDGPERELEVEPEPEPEPEAEVEAEVEAEADPEPDPLDGMSDVSEDTEGDIPSSPINARLDEEDFQEQVTTCAWDGCEAGDFGNMDRLVEHIHNVHIESRQKKYTCEWLGCSRKSMAHASGYALKAHMRSHTREKPFHCYLPECDRAFTRSDALAKHMRTVHETEALRPSDPVPKSMQSGTTGKSKLKIIIKTPQSHAAGQDDSINGGGDDGELSADLFTPLTQEQGFTPEELDMPLEKLYKLCRFQVRWAEEEGKKLQDEVKRLEAIYEREWREKEVLLFQVIQSEADWNERWQAVRSGAADVRLSSVLDTQETAGASSTPGAESSQKPEATTTVANGASPAPSS